MPATFDRAAFGRRLDEAIAASGLSRRELAKTAKLNRNTINGWAAGRVIPEVDRLDELARQLGVGPDWLLYGNASAAGSPRPPEAERELERVRGALRHVAEEIAALADEP